MSWEYVLPRRVSRLVISPRQVRLTPKRGGRNGLGFPALEKLTLDFSEWQLTDSEGLLVIRKSRIGLDSVGC